MSLSSKVPGLGKIFELNATKPPSPGLIEVVQKLGRTYRHQEPPLNLVGRAVSVGTRPRCTTFTVPKRKTQLQV